jgi:serine/threonine-protein kinase
MSETIEQRLGRLLAAEYQLRRELGGGGMSRVFLATDRALGRDVVIKTLPPDVFSTDALERFKREMRLAARLQHPNIVPLLAAGEVEGTPYYTMPWVEGASLRERLQRGPLPFADAISILRDMARALAVAHAQGIVHRDVKPENVLLASGAALITDFGVARALSEATLGDENSFSTGTGIAVGTPAYMAPEQFAADPTVDQRADLYAWGIVAYELLAGAHPFKGATGTALLQAHMATVPARLDRVVPAVPQAIADIVAQCLEKDPAARPSSTQRVVDALDAGATPQPGAARASTPSGARPRGMRVMAVVALIAIVAAGVWWWRGRGVAGNERMVAVAPFRVGGAAPAVHYLREGLVDLMTPQLLSIPGISAPNVRVMLAQWRRAAGSADADLPDDDARRLAGDLGAGQLILGEIVGTGDQLTVTARLVRVSDGTVLAPLRLTGRADSASALATRIVASLLSIRDGATLDRVGIVMSANSDAITSFLAAEHAYRRGRYAEALTGFSTAWQHDTTFALAALRTSMMNGWVQFAPVQGDWIARAWAHRDRLRGADSLLLVGSAGSTYPEPLTTHARHAQSWQLAERGNTAELWYAAGDGLTHNLTLSGDSTNLTRAIDAFHRAEALDSSFAPAIEHLAMLQATVQRDTVAARATLRRQALLDSLGDFYQMNRLVVATVSASATEVRRLARLSDSETRRFIIAAMTSGIELFNAHDSLARVVHDIADDLESEPPRRNGAAAERAPAMPAIISSSAYWWNAGRARAFAVPSRPDSALLLNTTQVLAALVWDGDSTLATRSAAELERWAATYTPAAPAIMPSSAIFALGLRAFDRGDTAAVERARATLRKFSSPPGEPWRAATMMVQEKLLAAHLAVARRAPDARTRLLELDSLLIEQANLSSPFARNLGNLLVSQLWEQAGDDARAWAAVNRRDGNVSGPIWGSTFVRNGARIAERMGKRTEAIDRWRRYIGIRQRADARLQADVADAKARLAKLERESAGR